MPYFPPPEKTRSIIAWDIGRLVYDHLIQKTNAKNCGVQISNHEENTIIAASWMIEKKRYGVNLDLPPNIEHIMGNPTKFYANELIQRIERQAEQP